MSILSNNAVLVRISANLDRKLTQRNGVILRSEISKITIKESEVFDQNTNLRG